MSLCVVCTQSHGTFRTRSLYICLRGKSCMCGWLVTSFHYYMYKLAARVGYYYLIGFHHRTHKASNPQINARQRPPWLVMLPFLCTIYSCPRVPYNKVSIYPYPHVIKSSTGLLRSHSGYRDGRSRHRRMPYACLVSRISSVPKTWSQNLVVTPYPRSYSMKWWARWYLLSSLYHRGRLVWCRK